MTKYKHIIFDLDGTIIESAKGILEAFSIALEKNSIKPVVKIDSTLIGPPLKQTISNLIGSQDSVLINKIADSFKTNYDDSGYKSSVMFDGIYETLDTLSSSGSILHIATNKRISPTLKIVDHLKIGGFFDSIYALDSFEPVLGTKTQMLGKVLSQNNILNDEAIYIGDRLDDGYASDENGLDFALAIWGFGPVLDKSKINRVWKLLDSPSDILGIK